MAQPAYTLNLEHFEVLLASRGFKTRTEFIEATGINRRTFQTAIAGERELTLSTVAIFLDAFEGVAFEYLFTRSPRVAALRIAA